MNNYSCLAVRCILADKEKIADALLTKLNLFTRDTWQCLDIKITNNEKYWKYEGARDLIFKISSPNALSVGKFIAIFNVTWAYSQEKVFAIERQQSVLEEDAVWNKNIHADETFLLPEVEWVHIYTWI